LPGASGDEAASRACSAEGGGFRRFVSFMLCGFPVQHRLDRRHDILDGKSELLL
jgi:hypothetical protein